MRRQPVLAMVALLAMLSQRAVAQPPPTDAQQLPTPQQLTMPPAYCLERAIPISLPAALQLAELANLDIAQAREVVNQALAQRMRAFAMTVPSLQTGTWYNHHEGQIQKTEGNIITANRDSLWVNTGPVVSYQFVEAVFAPMVANRLLQASRAGMRRTSNDTMLAVADAYFAVLRARRRLARLEDTMDFLVSDQPSALRSQSRGLLPLIRNFVEVGGKDALRSDLERVNVEIMRRQEEQAAAAVDFAVASAELARLLHLDPEINLLPVEDFRYPLALPGDAFTSQQLEQLVTTALRNRPELAENQALIDAARARVRTAQWRPLMPTLALAYNWGDFGGSPPLINSVTVETPKGPKTIPVPGNGSSGRIDGFATRTEFDAAIVWRLQNMGLGNAAEIREQQAVYRRSQMAQIQLADRVIAQVVQSESQVVGWRNRLNVTMASLFGPNYELTGPVFRSLRLNFERIRAAEGRPLEVLDSIRSLNDLLDAYGQTCTDYERARFRLLIVLGISPSEVTPPPAPPPPPAPGGTPVQPEAGPPPAPAP